jgi:cysteinyl-tRNA synthetase
MPIRLYNTLSRHKEVFEPADPERVTMYVCGPTVYSHPHIGNARPAVVFDLLYRVLSQRYSSVLYARNITDLDDKINAAASAEDVPIEVISARFTEAYHHDMQALGVLPPTVEPRATAHMRQMVALVERLVELGFAYQAEGHVLFHVPSFEAYGRLSGRNREDMIAGARVEVAPYKRDPADFVLWKPSTGDQPGWESPWGHGRPGWHTECAAMIETLIGETVDIHGGGHDLVFPHHENEIAQGVCAHGGAPLGRYWVHNGFVNVDSEKMSKSLGNVLLVRDLLERAPGEAVRLALLGAHYRSPLDWSAETLEQAARRLDRLYATLEGLADVEPEVAPVDAVPANFAEALEDDLNTPAALSHLAAMARAANAETGAAERARLKAAMLGSGAMLGLLQGDPLAWREARRAGAGDAADIERLVAERTEARAQRDFSAADRIRDELAALGVVLEDGAGGTRWRRADPSIGGGADA